MSKKVYMYIYLMLVHIQYPVLFYNYLTKYFMYTYGAVRCSRVQYSTVGRSRVH